MSNTLLEVNHLFHHYVDGQRQRTVLKDVNLTFDSGKLYAILGESGSGKTTLLSLLSGLDEVQEGTIKYQLKTIPQIGYTIYRRKYINVIFQSYNLIKYMTGLENILAAIDIKDPTTKNKRQLALDALAKVGINEETALREVGKISGGEQQRIAIARALIHNSRIIFADEPTGNLDEDNQEGVIDVFRQLANEGKCVVIVTHSRRVAASADTIYRIRKGAVIEEAPKAIQPIDIDDELDA